MGSDVVMTVMQPDYPFETLAIGDTREVAPGIHWIRMALPFQLNHVNLWLLEDDGGWTVVDTGYNTEDTRAHWKRAIERIVGRQSIRRTIVTHFHPDHLGLAGWFAEEYGTQLWITYAEYLQAHLGTVDSVTHDFNRWAAFFVENGLSEDRAAAYRANKSHLGDIMTPVPARLRRLHDRETFTINGREWQVITGGGHSPEHAALYCPALRVVISGDQVLPRITTNVSLWYIEPEGDPLRAYLRSFDKFYPLPDDVLVLPSHDKPFYGLRNRLDALIAHHDQRCEAAEKACADAKTAVDIIPVLFNRMLDDHQLGFAMGESLAHLNYLVGDGRLERVRDRSNIIRYQRIA
ncbi:MAG: MBL fold metallo-hydrolase [Alphaproteobacteria bacterium]|nr:MBL fold metallo-hydrolase [Alphaproteobacteria bacterium]